MSQASVDAVQPLSRDLSSLSNPHEVIVTHLDWHVRVEFESSTLSATATYTIDRIADDASVLLLDTNHLRIEAVTLQDGTPTPFKVHPLRSDKSHLGQRLEIPIQDDCETISIIYDTTPNSSAVQWIEPSQTAGKEFPYLFTQCQAIHARSLIPCQDCPGVKFSYHAQVSIPAWADCCMSAMRVGSKTNGTHKSVSFHQPVPISSYLLAMAVGDIVSKEISDRCAVWSEPSVIEAVAFEFSQTEDFLQTAEEIAGLKYVWGRYDLLCLPPSFPYGGMENPCLTFVTPTLLAGDRSLADVVAHEIAHSWTGNLVTNATWEHFWLNEGWTTWFQRKIMSRILANDKFIDFDAIGGYKHLEESVSLLPDRFTSLVPVLGDCDPDECFSSVPYEKGFNLLYALEKRVGSKAFEVFFQAYIKEFASRTVTTADFRLFFESHFAGRKTDIDMNWDTWFFQPGMPPETPKFDRSLSEKSENLAKVWLAVDRQGRMLPSFDLKGWSSNQITCFLDALQSLTSDKPLQVSTIQAINDQYHMAESGNSEILFRFCELAVSAGDGSILPVVVAFITTQGRMKFVRPLYRSLFQSTMGKELAVATFLEHKDFYHPICVKMIAQDLCVDRRKRRNRVLWGLYGVVAVGAAAAGLAFILRKRRR